MALPRDLGKPRPALIIQADRFERLATLTVLPITSTLVDAPLLRVTLEPIRHERSAQTLAGHARQDLDDPMRQAGAEDRNPES